MNIIVIDDFYRNADGTREFILTQPFNVVGNFPGKRTTSYANDKIKTAFENAIGKEIIYWPDGYSAMFGGRNDDNIINHIGEYTQGKKVLKGEPGWDWLKEYDPDKKYYSAGYLKEFTD